MAYGTGPFFLGVTLAFAMASPSGRNGDRLGGGSGPLHGFILLWRFAIHSCTILLDREPSLGFALTSADANVGDDSSSSARTLHG
jgi:hypothetical protein